MRLLGIRSGLPVFRWDLVYLLSNLVTDERAEIQALAPGVESLLGEVRDERDLLEQAEDGSVLATARTGKRDGALDVLIVQFGGVARATDRAVYDTCFPRHSPTRTARLGVEDEVREVGRILGELGALDSSHPLRVEYEAPMSSALVTLKNAKAESAQADTALALGRSRMERFKLRLDQSRVEVHGRLLSLLKDKAAADAFFRSSRKAPGDEAEAETDTETETTPADTEQTPDAPAPA